jgi:hypothetical protein
MDNPLLEQQQNNTCRETTISVLSIFYGLFGAKKTALLFVDDRKQ